MDAILRIQYSLDEELSEIAHDENSKINKINSYIMSVDKINEKIQDFGKNMDWLNLDIDSLKNSPTLYSVFEGKIVILDFFTYCCINCIHCLKTLTELENKYSKTGEVVIVGVHSAKFDNEKNLINVAQAVLKYNIEHCVINDPGGSLWEKLNICCWPTLVVLGPEFQILFVLVGERSRDKLFLYTELVVNYFSNQNRISKEKPIPVKQLRETFGTNILSFPGKIYFESQIESLIIADSGNHRIIIVTLEGVIKDIIGGSKAGFENGSFEEARFNNPQGIACYNTKCIFVADAGNHSIRKISLVDQNVTTVVGNGLQGYDLEGGNKGKEQIIASPWDLCFGPAIGLNDYVDDQILYIAMAGTHQIWGYNFQNCSGKLGQFEKESCFVVSGTGNEENRNNCYPRKASFAQPSGITLNKLCHNAEEKWSPILFIADSESSSIRSLSLEDGAVKAVVGGDRNPTDLFSFGDVDGKGYNVKLQHPVGICFCPKRNKIFVADTFNNKVKVVDPVTKECETLENIKNLNEPNGLCVYKDTLFVADTNNHEIKMYDLETFQCEKLNLYFVASDIVDSAADKKHTKSACLELSITPVQINPGGTLHLAVEIDLPSHMSFSSGAPHCWSIFAPNFHTNVKGHLYDLENSKSKGCKINLTINDGALPDTMHEAIVTVKIFVCDLKTGICLIKDARWCLKTFIVDKMVLNNVSASLIWKVGK